MPFRWVMGCVAALALALLTLPAGLPSSHVHAVPTENEVVQEPVCDAEARPANFDFTLEDMNGNNLSFESLRGKVLLLNFWATWCGPCKIEVPWLVEFADQYRDQGLVVLGLSIDDTADKIQDFARAYDVNYPMLIGLDRDDFQEAYGPIWGVPMTFFVDREGTICRTHAGIATREEFEKDIADLL